MTNVNSYARVDGASFGRHARTGASLVHSGMADSRRRSTRAGLFSVPTAGGGSFTAAVSGLGHRVEGITLPLWNTNDRPLLPNSFLYLPSAYTPPPPPLSLFLSPQTNSFPFFSSSLQPQPAAHSNTHCQTVSTTRTNTLTPFPLLSQAKLVPLLLSCIFFFNRIFCFMSCNKGFLCTRGREKRGTMAGEEDKPTPSVIHRGSNNFSYEREQLFGVELWDTALFISREFSGALLSFIFRYCK